MKLPESILSQFEKVVDDLNGFGAAALAISLHDGRPRFVISSEKSIVPGKLSSGSPEAKNGD